MPKVCCIINCHNSDCDQRNVFGVPKNEERRREWLDAIFPYVREGRKIRKQLYVCSSHFKDDDILRNTTIRLKDGSVETIAHSRIKLKPSSIPCIFNAKNKVLPNIDLPAVENETSNTLTSEREGQIELALEENRGSEVTNPEGEKKTRLFADGETAYNLEMLTKELTILWEEANNHIWGSCTTPCGRLFSFFGEDPKVATKTVLVKEDMSFEIRAAGQIIMTNLEEKIKSVDDVLWVMAEVQKNHLCQGIDDSTPCPYDYSESSTTTSSGRCSSCRIQRKKKKQHLSKQRKRSKLHANRTRLLIKKLRQKNQRLVKNIASSKEVIEDLQARCAAASTEGIEEGIKKFPSAQQEAVKACLTAAQCKGPTGMRYSQPWILECILLRIKSRRAYLHVLNHKILQVPTIEQELRKSAKLVGGSNIQIKRPVKN